jgi:hypothetical protein
VTVGISDVVSRAFFPIAESQCGALAVAERDHWVPIRNAEAFQVVKPA